MLQILFQFPHIEIFFCLVRTGTVKTSRLETEAKEVNQIGFT